MIFFSYETLAYNVDAWDLKSLELMICDLKTYVFDDICINFVKRQILPEGAANRRLEESASHHIQFSLRKYISIKLCQFWKSSFFLKILNFSWNFRL